MPNILTAINQERRAFLINLLSIGHSERDSIISFEVSNASDEVILETYEAAVYGNASNAKIFYLLGGNDPKQCPFA